MYPHKTCKFLCSIIKPVTSHYYSKSVIPDLLSSPHWYTCRVHTHDTEDKSTAPTTKGQQEVEAEEGEVVQNTSQETPKHHQDELEQAQVCDDVPRIYRHTYQGRLAGSWSVASNKLKQCGKWSNCAKATQSTPVPSQHPCKWSVLLSQYAIAIIYWQLV